MTPPTPADLAAALETVRKRLSNWPINAAQYAAACELLARHVAANAGRLRVETVCDECLGDGCDECNQIGCVYAPAFPEVEGKK